MENKEHAILKAAEEEFLSKGFEGARTTAIAEKAGVTHAMLHYYFRTKKSLFERILFEKVDLIATSFNSLLEIDEKNPNSQDYESIIRKIISRVGELDPVQFEVVTKNYGVKYISDHYPIVFHCTYK